MNNHTSPQPIRMKSSNKNQRSIPGNFNGGSASSHHSIRSSNN